MEFDFITKRSARAMTRETLAGFLAKNTARLEKMLAREAEGMAKLKKAEDRRLAKAEGVLPDLTKDTIPLDASAITTPAVAPPMAAPAVPEAPTVPPATPSAKCNGCGGGDTEALGNLDGQDHFICRTCGDLGTTVKEDIQQQDLNQAQVAAEALAAAPIAKADPTKPKIQSVENIRLGAGMTGAPKVPTVKKPEIPKTGADAPQKNPFNVGGANNGVTKAEIPASGKKTPFNTGEGTGGKPAREVPNQDVATTSAREGAVPPPDKGGKPLPEGGSGGGVVSELRKRAASKLHASRLGKADGIPAAPRAPGANKQATP
jgi:hypothetical protein